MDTHGGNQQRNQMPTSDGYVKPILHGSDWCARAWCSGRAR